MNTINNLLRERLYTIAEEIDSDNYYSLLISQWSEEFERLQRNRLVLGALRYGNIGAKGKAEYDRISCIINRSKKYKRSGNLEFIVDVTNLCMLEFVEGDHPNKHFNSIDDGEHTKEVK